MSETRTGLGKSRNSDTAREWTAWLENTNEFVLSTVSSRRFVGGRLNASNIPPARFLGFLGPPRAVAPAHLIKSNRDTRTGAAAEPRGHNFLHALHIRWGCYPHPTLILPLEAKAGRPLIRPMRGRILRSEIGRLLLISPLSSLIFPADLVPYCLRARGPIPKGGPFHDLAFFPSNISKESFSSLDDPLSFHVPSIRTTSSFVLDCFFFCHIGSLFGTFFSCDESDVAVILFLPSRIAFERTIRP